jgi:hypothetical protein
MRIISVTLMTATLAVTACATDHKPKERAISGDIVVANALCGGYAVRAATKDPPGERMTCGWEELVGTHVPRCICRDEKQQELDRDMAQQYLRDVEMGRCVSQGGGSCQ